MPSRLPKRLRIQLLGVLWGCVYARCVYAPRQQGLTRAWPGDPRTGVKLVKFLNICFRHFPKKTRHRMGADKHNGSVGAELLHCGLNHRRVWSQLNLYER